MGKSQRPSKSTVFISYRSPDRQLAAKLSDQLKLRGERVFFDAQELKPGDEWDQTIARALDDSRVLVVLISQGEPSFYQGAEIGAAIAASRASGERVSIIPVLLPGANIEHLPYGLARFQFIDARHRTPEEAAKVLADTIALAQKRSSDDSGA